MKKFYSFTNKETGSDSRFAESQTLIIHKLVQNPGLA